MQRRKIVIAAVSMALCAAASGAVIEHLPAQMATSRPSSGTAILLNYGDVPITFYGSSEAQLAYPGVFEPVSTITLWLGGYTAPFGESSYTGSEGWHGTVVMGGQSFYFDAPMSTLSPITFDVNGITVFDVTIIPDLPPGIGVLGAITYGWVSDGAGGPSIWDCTSLTRPDVQGIWLHDCQFEGQGGGIAFSAVLQAAEPPQIYLLALVFLAILNAAHRRRIRKA